MYFVISLSLSLFLSLSIYIYIYIYQFYPISVGKYHICKQTRMVTSLIPPRKKFHSFQFISVNTRRNSRFDQHGFWTLKLKSQPKKIKNRRRNIEMSKHTLQQKQKQNKKKHGEKFEKSYEMRHLQSTVIGLKIDNCKMGQNLLT